MADTGVTVKLSEDEVRGVDELCTAYAGPMGAAWTACLDADEAHSRAEKAGVTGSELEALQYAAAKATEAWLRVRGAK